MALAMNKSYREHFQANGDGLAYDNLEYGPNSYWALIWELEKDFLDRISAHMQRTSSQWTYLDFACGTGRVLAHLETRCSEATGIDISQEMLARAQRRIRRASLRCVDITTEDAAIEASYDLITAFRFFLNAEPELRLAALTALSRRLRNGDSRLVLSVHGNAHSYKALGAPVRLLRRLGGKPDWGHLTSLREVDRCLDASGLEVCDSSAVGILPPAVLALLPYHLRVRVEQALAKVPGVRRFGVDLLLVCRLKDAERG